MMLVFKYSKEAQGHHFTEDIPCNKLMRMPSAFLKCIYPTAVQHGEDKNTLLQAQEGSFCTQGQAACEIKSALLKRRSSSPIKELCLFLTNLLPTYGFQEGVPVHPTHFWPRQTDLTCCNASAQFWICPVTHRYIKVFHQSFKIYTHIKLLSIFQLF